MHLATAQCHWKGTGDVCANNEKKNSFRALLRALFLSGGLPMIDTHTLYDFSLVRDALV